MYEPKSHTFVAINKITHQNLLDYISFLNNKLNNIPKTRNRKIASLKRFFEYLSDNNYIDSNQSLGLKTATE